MIGPLLFHPIYQERVWGGRTFERALNRKLPTAKVIGESWEVVDRPEAQSVVARGAHAGRALTDLMATHGRALMGGAWSAGRAFPILVKWLDCRERLSLQVHPPAEVASQLDGEPKTENWFVAEATTDAGLVLGLKQGVTRDGFERAIHEQTLENCVHRFPVRAGDSLLVRSGRLHAIDAGCLILEIQQNSDTTYRVYDWGRVGIDGKPRQLHVAESMQCIDFDDVEPSPVRLPAGDALLAECAEFRLRRFEREPGATVVAGDIPAGEARLVHVVAGELDVVGETGRGKIVAGENLLLPASEKYELHPTAKLTCLVTDRFSGASC